MLDKGQIAKTVGWRDGCKLELKLLMEMIDGLVMESVAFSYLSSRVWSMDPTSVPEMGLASLFGRRFVPLPRNRFRVFVLHCRLLRRGSIGTAVVCPIILCDVDFIRFPHRNRWWNLFAGFPPCSFICELYSGYFSCTSVAYFCQSFKIQ
jgi:hypothetical protein